MGEAEHLGRTESADWRAAIAAPVGLVAPLEEVDPGMRRDMAEHVEPTRGAPAVNGPDRGDGSGDPLGDFLKIEAEGVRAGVG